RETVGGGVADDPVRIDDHRDSKRDPCLRMRDPKRLHHCRAEKKQRVLQAAQVLVVLSPGEVRVFIVGGPAEDDRPSLFKSLQLLVELDDLGRTDEGEVLGVRVEDDPLAGVVLVRNLFELFSLLHVHAGRDFEIGQLASRYQHVLSPLSFGFGQGAQRLPPRGLLSFRPRITTMYSRTSTPGTASTSVTRTASQGTSWILPDASSMKWWCASMQGSNTTFPSSRVS